MTRPTAYVRPDVMFLFPYWFPRKKLIVVSFTCRGMRVDTGTRVPYRRERISMCIEDAARIFEGKRRRAARVLSEDPHTNHEAARGFSLERKMA